MPNKMLLDSKQILLILTMSSILLFCQFVNAQNKSGSSTGEKITLPSEEHFEKATDFVSPWRHSGCNFPSAVQEPGCYKVPVDKYPTSNILTLYNEDGSRWYQFNIQWSDPDFYRKDMKPGFLPFATLSHTKSVIILRMVGESPHWYQVEVNEKTQETKYVLKSDPTWAKSTWSHWLAAMEGFVPKDSDNLLLDKPDGKVIEEAAEIKFEEYIFLKADGDWAYVEAAEHKGNLKGWVFKGWIRFRKGRELLVKSDSYLGFKVSDID